MTTPKPFVFVLMPFSEAFDDIYQLGIKPACVDAGTYCERLDEQIFSESMLERIYNQISKADIIVADMSGRNPNVFYEVGYAHALGKRVVLLTQNADDIPFDLKHYPHIVYKGKIIDLKEELRKKVQWMAEHPQKELTSVAHNVEFFLNGMNLQHHPEIHCNVEEWGSVETIIEAHNVTDRNIQKVSFQVGFIVPIDFSVYHPIKEVSTQSINLRNGRTLLIGDRMYEILPGSWESISVNFHNPKELYAGAKIDIVMRIFSEVGTQDYPFSVICEKKSK